MSQRGPSVSCSTHRYWIACLAFRIPPAGFMPDRAAGLVVDVADRLHHAQATGSVAAGLILPVDVLMKSAPAAIASSDARRTLS